MGFKARLTPYQKRAIPALVKSVAHWVRLAEGTQRKRESPDAAHCACCIEFAEKSRCGDCPIQLRSGNDCFLTPYEDANTAFNRRQRGFTYLQSDMDAMRTYIKDTLRMVRDGKITPKAEGKHD